jgi:NADPH-dependent 2,4-dienoyl-CoA reductase/sulfur reductase-like enzyme
MKGEDLTRVVIVGASAAGLSVAGGLRAGGFTGVIRIIGDETATPYDRPPLTKQVLAGQWPPERAQLLSDARLRGLDLELNLGRRAVGLDVTERRIITDDEAEHAYDALVVATGVRPRSLPGGDLAGIHLLRTMDQAMALRSALTPSARLVVVGGGFLGLEAAATARTLGAEVTVIEPVAHPLANRLGHRTAAKLVDLHEQHGVEILAGVGVTDWIQSSSGVSGVRLDDGRVLDADVVLVAIGCTPCTDWLAGSGLRVADGLICDEYCQAGPGVWAAGDVARWLHIGAGREIRLEHRTNAGEQGGAVARAILGERVPFDPVPFFWTDHYDVKIQVAGVLSEDDTAEFAQSTKDNAFIEVFRARESVSCVLGWNAPRELVGHRRDLESRRPSRADSPSLGRS